MCKLSLGIGVGRGFTDWYARSSGLTEKRGGWRVSGEFARCQLVHLIPIAPVSDERPLGKSRKRVNPVPHTEPPEPDPIYEAHAYCNTPSRTELAWEDPGSGVQMRTCGTWEGSIVLLSLLQSWQQPNNGRVIRDESVPVCVLLTPVVGVKGVFITESPVACLGPPARIHPLSYQSASH
ncbi:hypothetical protein JZ751_013382 [Albula glossodonta]|uniref:Uncharacterized protein n=1 Tax=Albula glossodonta TaxID=121402 RepID=A0A8T2MYH2_9TELE|nr:hypothetical protein JZ751_013382 [Albula glossodonta]